MNRLAHCVMSLSLALAVGCGSELGTIDDRPVVVDGKMEAGGKTIFEGSAEACGVLEWVNGASLGQLEKLMSDADAAQSIMVYRVGPDGELGTWDDQRFDTLAELGAVERVNSPVMVELVTHALAQGSPCQTIDVQILSISDWHGQLDPVSVYNVGKVGGAATLATLFNDDRSANPNTLVLTAGDTYGASPPLSGFFDERPTIEVMNRLRFDADALGNHSFDRGVAQLQSLIEIADFPSLSANLEHVPESITCAGSTGAGCIRPYTVVPVAGVYVGVVGLLTPDTPNMVKPGNMGTILVTDPVQAAASAQLAATKNGAQILVAVAHIGMNKPGSETEPASGPLVELAQTMTGYDLLVGGHTHMAASTTVNGLQIVQNKSQGLTYSRVRLTYDFSLGQVVDASAEIVEPLADGVTPDDGVVKLIDPYRTQLAQAFDKPIGQADDLFERGNNVERMAEVPVGNLVADALRLHYGVQLALVNGGGLRSPLPSSYAPEDKTLRRTTEGYAAGPPYDLVVGDVYTLLPFGNTVVTRTVTGAQLWEMVEHSVEALPAPKGWFAQISGFRFTFDSSLLPLSRVTSLSLADGTPIASDNTTYTLATSDFLDAGGDGYTMLKDGDGVPRDMLADVVLQHIKSLSVIQPTVEGRIVDQATTTPTP